MYTIDEVIEIVMDTDCNDLTVGDCFDEQEVVKVINRLSGRWKIGDAFGEVFDDKDIDTIIDNLN